MAEKKIWIGSVGPFLYDDAENVQDPDGTFSGKTQRGVFSEGAIYVDEKPVDSDEVVRMEDLSDGDVLNGDIIDIDFTPSQYSPDGGAPEAADADDLAAHLKGIDDELDSLDSSLINLGSDVDDLTEYGTWTPTLEGGVTAGSHTYNTRYGRYTVVGDIVTAYFEIIINSGDLDGSIDGIALISGFPYNARRDRVFGCTLSIFIPNSLPSDFQQMLFRFIGSELRFFYLDTNGGNSIFHADNLDDSSNNVRVNGSITYERA